MTETQDQNRQRILDATEHLLRESGRDALTVRAVAEAAGVQLPTIYRLFVDKVGLLEAVVERGFLRYMAIEPAPNPNPSELDLLRHGWDIHVRFGRENPELYSLMYGDFSMRKDSPALAAAQRGLQGLFDRVARAGLLRLSQEEAQLRAFASASGAVVALQFLPPGSHAEAILVRLREDLIQTVTTEGGPGRGPALDGALGVLEGNLPSLAALSVGERALLGEWLGRLRTATASE